MLGSASAIAFVPSTDLVVSQRFYGDTLGLPVEETDPYACVLRAGGTMLRLTKVGDLRPQPFTVFGWDVPDIHATLADLAAADVAVERFDGVDQDADGIWTTPNGDRITWFRDPDGNILSLAQFA